MPDNSLDRLLCEVQQMAIQNGMMGESLKSAHRRIDELEELRLQGFVAKTEERLSQGVKHFEKIDYDLDEKVDKKSLKWLLTGMSVGGGGLGALAAKLAGLL